jgi:AraC-like DNA-binding protein
VDGLVQAYLGALTRQFDSLADAEMGAVIDIFCRLIAIACGAAAAEQRDPIRAARLVQAKRYIELHLSEPNVTPARVAAALKISVRQVHLLFEPTGTSFAEHVTARRLEECRAALASRFDGSRPIADIAFAWGFNNLGTFYRTFQRQFGMAPGDLRSAALRARAPGP